MAGVLIELEHNGRKLVVTEMYGGNVAFMTYRVTRVTTAVEGGETKVSEASGYVASREEAQALHDALGKALRDGR